MLTRRITVSDGVALEASEAGEGPPVLLLHGFPNSQTMWGAVTEHLVAAGHRVIAYDQRGFGASDAPAGRRSYAIDRLVEDAAEVLSALEVRTPVTIVGHDWGALVGWAVCASRPELVGRHVAISWGHPSALRRAGPEQWRKNLYAPAFLLTGIAERMLSRHDFALLRRVGASHPDIDGAVAALSRPGRLTAALNWYRKNLFTMSTRRWGRCRVPTLGVWSSGDAYFAEKQMSTSARYVDAPWEYVRIPDAGHSVPMEQPERVATLIVRWIAGS